MPRVSLISFGETYIYIITVVIQRQPQILYKRLSLRYVSINPTYKTRQWSRPLPWVSLPILVLPIFMCEEHSMTCYQSGSAERLIRLESPGLG